jgi:hypothetical protein
MLAFELSSCHSSITSFKSLNDDLNARIEKLSVASSSMEHVSICAKCKDHDFDACSNHASTIAKLNDEIVQLNVHLKLTKNEVEKIKFARDAFTIGRHPPLRMDLVSKRELRTLTDKRPSTSQRGRERHLWLVDCTLLIKRKTMLIYILMLIMFLIMLIMMIVLFLQSIMIVSLLIALCLLHLVILVGEELGAILCMLFLI